MTLQILTNAAGENASSIAFTGASVNSDYQVADAIAGPRSLYARSQTDAGPVDLEYEFAADVEADYLVVARADKLITVDTMDITIRERSSVPAWATIGGTGKQPLASSDLIGIKSQDYVETWTPTNKRGYGLRCETQGGGSEAVMISKLFFASAFTFGVEPEMAIREADSPSGELIVPPDGDIPFEVERSIQLVFANVTAAKKASFLALPQIFKWPFFLYDDSSGDKALWAHQLEHVILESFEETYLGGESDAPRWQCTLNVRRLMHYG